MGMHREASKWGIGGAELEERRRVFWETHIYDRLVSDLSTCLRKMSTGCLICVAWLLSLASFLFRSPICA
jgi:hypothetical protein